MISLLVDPRDQLLDLLSYPNHWFEYGLSSNQIRTNDIRNVVLLVVVPRAYTIISFRSDQYYHRVHMMAEVQWYGNSDELLLSPSATFSSPPWFMLNINLVLETFISIIFMSHSWRICWMKPVTFSKFTCNRCKLPPWIRESLLLLPLESSQVSHACAKYTMFW